MLTHPATPVLRGHVEAALDDGRVVMLRPLRGHETAPLLEVFAGMSELSRARRYLTGMPHMPANLLRRLVDVDGRDHVAWLATIDGEPAGIARYAAANPCIADVAFEVVDRHHHLGLGGILIDTIATVASSNGFTGVTATVHPSNHASVRLLRRIGLTLRVSSGLLEGEGRLRLPDPPRIDRRAVREVIDGTVVASPQ